MSAPFTCTDPRNIKRLEVYANLTAAMCDADKRSSHWPTQVNSRINNVHHFAAVYAENADELETIIAARATQREQGR